MENSKTEQKFGGGGYSHLTTKTKSPNWWRKLRIQ